VACYPASGIARVDHQLRGIHDSAEIVAGMVGGNDHRVVAGQGLWVQRNGLNLRDLFLDIFFNVVYLWLVVL
jgi:hypothetical protein